MKGKGKKVKVMYSCYGTPCHSYGITQCYLLPDTSERTPPSSQPVGRQIVAVAVDFDASVDATKSRSLVHNRVDVDGDKLLPGAILSPMWTGHFAGQKELVILTFFCPTTKASSDRISHIPCNEYRTNE